jgi:hypothetical protein
MPKVNRPIPMPYTCCPDCVFDVNRVTKDCGKHSTDYAWQRLVETLESQLTQMRNERDYYKALHESGVGTK